MKGPPLFLYLTSLLLFSSPCLGEEEGTQSSGGRILATEDGQKSAQKLEQLLKIDFVASAVERCKAAKGVQDITEDVVNCLWSDSTNGLKEEEKSELYKKLAQGDEGDKNQQQYNDNLSNFKKEKSPPLKKLEKFLTKELEKALQKDAPKGGVKAVSDHVIFYKIFRSELGQNLITQLSSYCIYSNSRGQFPDCDPLSEGIKGNGLTCQELLEENKEKNLENLTKIDEKKQRSVAYSGFVLCIQNIGKSCEENNKPHGNYRLGLAPNSLGVASSCEMNRIMNSVKKSIARTSDIIASYDELAKKSAKQGHQAFRNANNTEVDIKEITNIGSKKIAMESGYEKESQKLAQEIEEKCVNKEGSTSDPFCQKYLTDKKKNEELAAEYQMRNTTLSEKVNSDIEESGYDKEVIKKIYKEQGLSDEKFEQLYATVAKNIAEGKSEGCNTAEKCLAEKIKSRYENEKKQLNESLRAKLKESQSSDRDGEDTPKKNLKSLAERYKNAGKNLAEIYQYANIVSSFLEVHGENGEESKNTAALAAELKDSYFSASANQGRETPLPERDLSSLDQFNTKSKSSESEDIMLGSDTINNFQWDIEEGKEKKQDEK